jgi:transmembrane sensor
MSETERTIVTETGEAPAAGERVQQEAQDWLRRLTSGDVSKADLDALDRWRAASPEHRRALAEANLLWDVLGRVAREATAPSLAYSSLGSVRGRPIARRALLGGAVAASAAYLLARPPFHLWPEVAELMASYHTATGEHRELAVAPGIAVQMDTQTSLNTSATPDRLYALELVSGQLAVSVLGAGQPLVVAAADGQIRAERAKFDVRRNGASVCVTCNEGAVDVSYRSASVTIGPGRQVTYDERGLGAAVAADPALVTAWQRGMLVFRDARLVDVIAEVNRYRPGRIILLNKALEERKVLAGFRLDRIDDVVNYIRDAFDAKVRSLPGGVVLLS